MERSNQFHELTGSILSRIIDRRTRASAFATAIFGSVLLALLDASHKLSAPWAALYLCALLIAQSSTTELLARRWPALVRNGMIADTSAALPNDAGSWRAQIVDSARGILLALLTFPLISQLGTQATETYTTKAGEQKVVTLPNLTEVTLNTDSTLEVRSTDHGLQASVLKGEALFSVVHDDTHPFTVLVGDLAVEDIGTLFDVRLQPTGDVSVTVAKGSLTVRPAEAGSQPEPFTQTVSEGQIAVQQNNRLTPKSVDSVEIRHQIEWATGQLISMNSTVANVAAKINRYSNVQLVIDDPDFARQHLAGSFYLDSPEQFVIALKAAFPSKGLVTHRQGDIIRIDVEKTGS